MFLYWHNNSKFYKIFEQDDSKIKLMEDITAADGNQHFWSTWDGHDGVLFNLCWYYEYSYFRERQTEFYPVLTVQNYGSSTNLQMPVLSWCLHYYQSNSNQMPSPISNKVFPHFPSYDFPLLTLFLDKTWSYPLF